MFKFVIFSLLAISAITQAQQNPADAQATVLSNNFADDGAGNFLYNYETSNQIKADAKGLPKQVNDADGKPISIETQQGTYSFVAPDGQTYTVEWTADENGYQAKGAHIPVPPSK
ncbi:hypothetical protein PVAND_016457 [Polypedilum vanderplanki]|uniref:Cuticular protein n=1 Tax=Polypedilum vanderplanki TaxID=319348 RepID=A0A9J6BGC0_POLVA|nr:hypothetical protein PVAND_016457 [Polypedilum vanderplanki]